MLHYLQAAVCSWLMMHIIDRTSDFILASTRYIGEELKFQAKYLVRCSRDCAIIVLLR